MSRIIKRRTPSGRISARLSNDRIGKAHCSSCGSELHGMPRKSQKELRKLTRTEKRPQRIFGGYYCSACTREILRDKARSIK